MSALVGTVRLSAILTALKLQTASEPLPRELQINSHGTRSSTTLADSPTKTFSNSNINRGNHQSWSETNILSSHHQSNSDLLCLARPWKFTCPVFG
ncbi:uncharacterized protein K444DRAFT_606492 [Hyaloscypha bicolor E]|uniref:Secreted protein n=1 Tax=Hyaloscypha bicolor E TaxID=1095630 RepID=A0A2J6TX68_9HELO|nr:uncharacterized protein K444DRAFT_606492 [Hyaloscypha bicolor E]PMD67571.1 hypothetical protein K444DRAFT_606492 [Hyaloscypha bicolor E]